MRFITSVGAVCCLPLERLWPPALLRENSAARGMYAEPHHLAYRPASVHASEGCSQMGVWFVQLREVAGLLQEAATALAVCSGAACFAVFRV